jgi:hypothetical protein
MVVDWKDRIVVRVGFQDGVDLGVADAALAKGLATIGAMPAGFMTLSGPRPEYTEKYNAYESLSGGYAQRTVDNAIMSDLIVILGRSKDPELAEVSRPLRLPHSAGTALAINEAYAHNKPLLVADLSDIDLDRGFQYINGMARTIARAIKYRAFAPTRLGVVGRAEVMFAGPRESDGSNYEGAFRYASLIFDHVANNPERGR